MKQGSVYQTFLPNVFKMLFLSANQLPAGLITTDGQQQNVMVYTTSYQQVWSCILSPTLPSAAKIQRLIQLLCSERWELILYSPLVVAVMPFQHWEFMAACCELLCSFRKCAVKCKLAFSFSRSLVFNKFSSLDFEENFPSGNMRRKTCATLTKRQF